MPCELCSDWLRKNYKYVQFGPSLMCLGLSLVNWAHLRTMRRVLPPSSTLVLHLPRVFLSFFFLPTLIVLWTGPCNSESFSSLSRMKVKVISRSTDEFTRERSQDLQVISPRILYVEVVLVFRLNFSLAPRIDFVSLPLEGISELRPQSPNAREGGWVCPCS